MTILFYILGLTAIGIVLAWFAAETAPVGYEDEAGFHFGSEQADAHQAPAWGTAHPTPA